jgi:hypothetical protein
MSKREINFNFYISLSRPYLLNKVIMLLIQNIQYLHLTVQNNLMFTKILECLVDWHSLKVISSREVYSKTTDFNFISFLISQRKDAAMLHPR